MYLFKVIDFRSRYVNQFPPVAESVAVWIRVTLKINQNQSAEFGYASPLKVVVPSDKRKTFVGQAKLFTVEVKAPLRGDVVPPNAEEDDVPIKGCVETVVRFDGLER
jgi:hypothetical protein